MSYSKITDTEIKEKGVSALRDAPNRRGGFGTNGLSAQDLKERFDALPKLTAERLNALIDAIESGEVKIPYEDYYGYETFADFFYAIGSGNLAKKLKVNVENTLADFFNLVTVYRDIIEFHRIQASEIYAEEIHEYDDYTGKKYRVARKADLETLETETESIADSVSGIQNAIENGELAKKFRVGDYTLEDFFKFVTFVSGIPTFSSVNVENSISGDSVRANHIYIHGEGDQVDVVATEKFVTGLFEKITGGDVTEALDTLIELASALNNDPDFAANVIKELSGKVNKTDSPLKVYGTDAAGKPAEYSAGLGGVAKRDENGEVEVEDGTKENSAVSKRQMDSAIGGVVEIVSSALAGKLDASKYKNGLYGVDNAGNQKMYDIATGGIAGAVAVRGANGSLMIGAATAGTHAVPLGQLKTILDERIEEVETKVDRTSRRLSSISGSTYETVVKRVSWLAFIDIPTTALPCIQVNRLSGYSERVSTGADVLSSQARTVDVNTSAVIAAMDGSTFVQTANLKTDYSHETFGVNVAPIDQFSAHTLSAEVMLVGDFSSVTPSKKMVVDGWCDASDYGMENYFPTASCTFGDELIEGGAYKTGVWIKCSGSIWIDSSGPTGGTCTGAYIGFADNIPAGCEVRIRNMRIVKEGEDDIVSINISKPSKLYVRSGNNEVIDLPELISLPGWGFRLSDAVCNYYDFTSGEYVQMVGERAYKSGDESASQVITDGVTSLYTLDSEIRSKVDIGFDGFIFITAGKGAYIYKYDASDSAVRGLIEVEYDTEV